jgi:DNA-binding transcriptional regulator YdaS (Cro superfamily)
MNTYDYSKLEGKIKEKVGTQYAFADLLGISNTSLVSKLKSRTQFTQEEILKAASILKIPTKEITSYFFSIKS